MSCVTKRTSVSQFPTQGRGGSGVQVCKLDTEQLLSGVVRAFTDTEMVMVTSKKQSYALKVTDVPLLGRTAAGSNIFKLRDKEKINGMILCQQIHHNQTKTSRSISTDIKRTNKKSVKHKTTGSNKSTTKKVSQRKQRSKKSPKDQSKEQMSLFKKPK